MKIAYLGCVVGGLVVGVGLGWTGAAHGRLESRPVNPLVNAPAVVATATVPVDVSPAPLSDSVRSAEAETLHRLEVLRWLIADARRRQMLSLHVFGWTGRDKEKLDPGFVAVFGLTSEETTRLEADANRVRRELEAQMIPAAQVTVSPDNSRAQILVPPLLQEGGRGYDELLRTFKETLGPERAAYFGAIAGDSFDDEFRNFGAMERKFELERVTLASGENRVVVKEESAVPGENRSFSSHQQVIPSEFPERFPVLAKVLPATFIQPEPSVR